MSLPSGVQLLTRVDEFSCQVFTEADPRFWFRLVRETDRDLITDYFLGSFPVEQGGGLLAECYRVLGLTPKPAIVFRDILSGRDPSDASSVAQACDLYRTAGESLLSRYGFELGRQTTETHLGKIDLLLFFVSTTGS